MVIFSVFVSPCPWPSTFFSFTSTENVPSLLFDTVCVTEELPAFKMIWEEESVGLLASIETSVTFSSFFSSSSSSSSSSDDDFVVSWCTFALKRVTVSFSFSTLFCSMMFPREASSFSSSSFFTNSTSPIK